MNTTSHIEAFNAELMDAKREALVAIRALVRFSTEPVQGPARDPRILAQARMAATQVLRTAFLKPEPSAPPTRRDREGACPTLQAQPAASSMVSDASCIAAPAEIPNPADQRRAQQIERIAQQAKRDLERYQEKLRRRDERDQRRASELTARAGAGSPA